MKVLMILFPFLCIWYPDNHNKGKQYEGTYYGNGQVCYITYVVDKKWVLSLKSDNKFEFTRVSFNSKTKDSIIDKFLGKWLITNDSLLVLKNLIRNSNYFCPNDSFTYIIDENKLYSRFNCIDYFPETEKYLAYLEKDFIFSKSIFIRKN